jgi:hypothetical protein
VVARSTDEGIVAGTCLENMNGAEAVHPAEAVQRCTGGDVDRGAAARSGIVERCAADAPDLVGAELAEPEAMIRPFHNSEGARGHRRYRQLGDGAIRRNTTDLVAAGFDKPKGAVRSHRDPLRLAVGRRWRVLGVAGEIGLDGPDLIDVVGFLGIGFGEPQLAVRPCRNH